VLVVDDDRTTRDLLRLYLANAGYRVSTAVDGDDALQRVRAERPDLITLDLAMPGSDGFSVLRQLASEPAFAGIPVLVVSGAEEPTRALAVGAHAVLPKPIQRHTLLEIVHRFLPQRGEHRPAVLLVDDDPKVINVVRAYFDGERVDVDYVYGGAEALEAVRARRPDVMVLDLMMPGVTGFDVLAAMRRDPATATLPVIVLTAKELTPDERRQLDAGAQAVLAKGTTSRGDVVAEVHRLLAGDPTCSTAGER
jgi:CheY-like chemotaxis protein